MRTSNSIQTAREFPSNARKQRGVALLLTIFGLLLLTAVAVAMLYSSNSETLIAVNYRDKQVATYAALSGLDEARQRIHPTFGDLTTAGYVPTATPDAGGSGGYVLYILNPNTANGETAASIAPWNYNSGNNPYLMQSYVRKIC
jgi:Tfp pilus assembly protein PilX